MGKVIDRSWHNKPAVAVVEGGQPEIITNAEGERITPSVVALRRTENAWSVRWQNAKQLQP